MDPAIPNPVIVVPGITATCLRDEYPLPPEIVWSMLTKDYERVSLHPDNIRYEAREPARLQPDQVYEIAYKELVQELRYNLSPRINRCRSSLLATIGGSLSTCWRSSWRRSLRR